MAEQPKAPNKMYQDLTDEEWVSMIIEKRKKRKEDNSHIKERPHVTPHFPDDIRKHIEEILPEWDNEVFVIEKKLTNSDVDLTQNRFNMPCTELETFPFLNMGEISLLRRKQKIFLPIFYKTKIGELREIWLNLSQKNMHENSKPAERVSSHYALQTEWNQLIKEDKLEEGENFQCWALKSKGEKLVGFVVVNVEEENHIIPYIPDDFTMKFSESLSKENKAWLLIQRTMVARDVKTTAWLSIPCREVERFCSLKAEDIGFKGNKHSMLLPVFHKTLKENEIKESIMSFSLEKSRYVWKSLMKEGNMEEGKMEEGQKVQCWAITNKGEELVGLAILEINLFFDNEAFWEKSSHHGFDNPLL